MVNMNELPGYIMAIVVVGILAGAGILINDELKGTIDSTNTFTITNETIVIVAAGIDLVKRSVEDPSVVTILNTTAPHADANLNASSYVINTTGTTRDESPITYTIYLNDRLNPSWEGTSILLTYSGENYNTQANAISNATQGVANITAQIPVVGTIVGVALIVGVVLLLFVAFNSSKKY